MTCETKSHNRIVFDAEEPKELSKAEASIKELLDKSQEQERGHGWVIREFRYELIQQLIVVCNLSYFPQNNVQWQMCHQSLVMTVGIAGKYRSVNLH